jgi:hypothetical protein
LLEINLSYQTDGAGEAQITASESTQLEFIFLLVALAWRMSRFRFFRCSRRSEKTASQTGRGESNDDRSNL